MANRRKHRAGSFDPNISVDDWRRRVRAWKETGIWSQAFGPAPDQALTLCPRGVLIEFNVIKD